MTRENTVNVPVEPSQRMIDAGSLALGAIAEGGGGPYLYSNATLAVYRAMVGCALFDATCNCAFEKYEDAAPASVEVEKMAAVMRGMLRRGTVIDGDAISRAARLATYQQDPNDEDRRWADEQAQALSRKQEPGGKG